MHVEDWLDRRIIFMCVAGSHAYGLNNAGSDNDFRGVCVPPMEYFTGMQQFEQKDGGWPDNEDRVIYNVAKFLELAAKANPNILELMFMPDDCIFLTTPLWESLVANRDMFLTKKVKHTYAGYAHSQLKRIETHRRWLLNPPSHDPTRQEFGLAGPRVSNETFGLMELLFKGVTDAETLVNVQDDGGLSLPTKHALWVNFEKERKWRAARGEWEKYQQWVKERNPARAELERKFGYDTKHASHCVRLMLQGIEILTKGTLHARLDPTGKEMCLGIKNGCAEYTALMELCQGYMDQLECAYQLSTLPHSVDSAKVEELQMRSIQTGNHDNGAHLYRNLRGTTHVTA